MSTTASNKRQRIAGNLNSTENNTDLAIIRSQVPVGPAGFNDSATADVLLRLDLDGPPPYADDLQSSLVLYVLSSALRRSRYFDALLSGRWPGCTAGAAGDVGAGIKHQISLKVRYVDGVLSPFDAHVDVLRLLHTLDFSGEISSVYHALDLIPVCLELLFDDCLRACVRYIEAVPWTEDEEEEVLNVIPLLSRDESRELIARVCPEPVLVDDFVSEKCTAEDMLYGLLEAAIKSHPNGASVKIFVAKLLEDYCSRDLVRKVLERAFLSTLETLKEFLGKFARPDLRVAADYDEREAMQRLNLHSAMVNAKHLLWLVERMIELRVADSAVCAWSDQAALAADLRKTFKDDGWQNIAPGLPLLITRCTFKLAAAVASGTALVPGQVRMKLVRDWLQVLNACKDIISPLPTSHKSVYLELEETFLKIISTLPLSDAQRLLQQCLGFSTRNIDDCPHLLMAFQTWFKRANRPPFDDKAS